MTAYKVGDHVTLPAVGDAVYVVGHQIIRNVDVAYYRLVPLIAAYDLFSPCNGQRYAREGDMELVESAPEPEPVKEPGLPPVADLPLSYAWAVVAYMTDRQRATNGFR